MKNKKKDKDNEVAFKLVKSLLLISTAILFIGGVVKFVNGDKYYNEAVVENSLKASISKVNQVYLSEKESGSIDVDTWDSISNDNINNSLAKGKIINEFGRVYEEYPSHLKKAKTDGENSTINMENNFKVFPSKFIEVHLGDSGDGVYLLDKYDNVYYEQKQTS